MLQKRLAEGFEALGIRSGDTLLVHSSLKSLEGASPADVIEALLALLGPEGTLMFPTLSYLHSNRNNPVFDVRRTPSNVGAIPEYFRTEYPALRSLCPTHSCAAVGLRAEYLTGAHHLDDTPCGPSSPFRRLRDAGGKVLFIGCGTRPNTSMHAAEELSRPPYLFGPPVRYQMTDAAGRTYTAICVSHGFAGVSQRYERLVPLLPAGGYAAANVHTAFCELIDAAEMWRTADERYRADPLYFVDTAE